MPDRTEIEVTLTGREIGLVRQAIVLHPPSDDRMTNKVLRQLEKGPVGQDENDRLALKVGKSACAELSSSLAALKAEPHYSTPSLQVKLLEVGERFAATAKSFEQDNDPAARKAERAEGWVQHSESLRQTFGGKTPVPLAEQIDQANARAKDRLAARLAEGNEPTEPRLPGFECPHQLQLGGGRGM